MTNEETLKLALRALRFAHDDGYKNEISEEAITAIKEALNQEGQSNFCAQCEALSRELIAIKQEPVAEPHKSTECVSEPVAWMQDSIELYVQDRPSEYYTIPLYTTPNSGQQHIAERKPLTEEQIEQAENQIWNTDQLDEVERQANKEFVRAIEAAHSITKEKNT